jgi:hypothetical protein
MTFSSAENSGSKKWNWKTNPSSASRSSASASSSKAKVSPASFDMDVRQRVPPFRPEDYAHMIEGLRKAGWNG